MESINILSLAVASPFDKGSPADLLLANMRAVGNGEYSCSDVVLAFADRHLVIETAIKFLPRSAVHVLSDVEEDDPDYGSYVSVLASLRLGEVVEGAVLQGRFGPSVLTRLPESGQVEAFDMSSGVYMSVGEELGRDLCPFKLSAISHNNGATITLLQHGLFRVVVEPR